ncbi:MAG: glycosyltransferase family 39 protein, partial [Gemmatimonadetes bacterium]|nr:glycosyltransferase family 39 protein [Gemmatimonadota bacterium]
WEWSRRPAPSYFDHPPAIAAVIAFGTALFGETRVGVRFGSILLSLLGSIAAVSIANRLAGGKAALIAALALAVMPMAAAGLLLATPDAPLLAAFAVGTWALIRAVEKEPRSMSEIAWWCAAGLALGAALLSKYTAILLPAGVALGFGLDPRLRRRLLTPGPWIGVGLGLAAFSPVIMWNAQLGWPSFAFQLDHGLGGSGSDAGLIGQGLGAANRLLEYLGGQMGLLSPILFVLMGIATIAAVRIGMRGEGDSRRTVLAGIAVVVFATFALSALRRRVEPNWAAPAYVAGVVLLGTVAWRDRGRRWLQWGLGLGAGLMAVVYVQALVPALPIDARRDPIAQGHGWEWLAEVTGEARTQMSAAGCPAVYVATNRYQEASELAFHLPDQPAVTSLNIRRRSNQYDLWPGFEDMAGIGDCLLFVDIDDGWARQIVADLGGRFESTIELGPAQRKRGVSVTADYRLWAFKGWTGDVLTASP